MTGGGWRSWVGPTTVVFTAAMMLVVGWYANPSGDFVHMLDPMRNLLADGLGGVYVEGVEGTSLSGWLALTALPFVVGGQLYSEDVSWLLAGLVAAPLLVGGVRYAARAIWPSMSVERAWGVAAVSLLLPTTVSGWVEYYHPQDVAAVGLVAFGLGLAAKHRWVAAGAMIGFAVVTRHWALLIAIAVASLAGKKDVVRYVAGFVGVVVVAVVPLVVSGNEMLWYAVSARGAAVTDQTLLGRLLNSFESPPDLLRLVVRSLPVAGAVALAAVGWVRRWGTDKLVVVAVTAMTLRIVFETAPYTYYWAPIPVLLLLVTPRKESLFAGVILALFVWPVRPFGESPTGEIVVAAIVLLLASLAIYVAWLLTDDPPETRDAPYATTTRSPWWAWVGSAAVAVVVLAAGIPVVAAEKNAFFVAAEESKAAAENMGGVEFGAFAAADIADNNLIRVEGFSFSGEAFSFTPGTPTVIGVFSHWCEQCPAAVSEFLSWERQQRGAVDAFGVFTRSDPQRGNFPTEIWLLSLGWDVDDVADDAPGTLGTLFGFVDRPVFLVVGADGEIVDRWEGPFDAARVDAAVGT